MLDLFKNKKQPVDDAVLESEKMYQKGLARVKDLIAPSAIKISPGYIEVGDIVSKTIFVVAFPKFLSTNWFSPIINIDYPVNISMFVHPMDTRDILKNLRKSATQVQSQLSIESESGKIRNPVLESAFENIEDLRTKLQEGTEKFFRVGIYITAFGEDIKEVNKVIQSVESILEAQLVYVKPADFRMEQGFLSTIPVGEDSLGVANNLNTSPLSTTFPFVSADLSSNEGILYGINRHNNSLILFDRFAMENANMVVFAKSGAGKSYAIKLEILRSLMLDTSVIIIDPENEYKHLCNTVGGSFVKISLSSKSHLNPFDIPKVQEDENPADVLRNNIANLIGLLHIMLGHLTPEEDSILDRAIHEVYAIRDITPQTNFNALAPESFPTMSDLYEVLRNMDEAESLATRLERYTEGIFSGFINQHTNINVRDNQLVVFNIRDLEEELRPIAMYSVLQYIWNEMRSDLKRRMVVVDEAWVMMKNEDAASFLFGIAKRCRKYYTGLTTITQDINDFLNSRYGKPIVTNSSIQLLLKQSPAAIDNVVETFYLTDQEKFLLLESNVGEGIFFAGNKHAAIKIIASYSEDQIITSDPRQLLEIEEAKKALEEEEGL
ncbi:VirB4-like conjugal transfer ATPase, CD1110 family [Patescibacteria group bacterium]